MAKFDNLEMFWEFIKAQGVMTAQVWSRSPHQEEVRRIDPTLARHLDALSEGAEAEVGE